jgi:intein/homing endonuclease
LVNTPTGLYKPSALTENTQIILNSSTFKSKGFRKTGIKPLYQIETEAGRKIKVTGEHLMFTDEGILAASTLKLGDILHISNNSQVEFKHVENNDFKLGYLVGALLGDGNYANGYAQIKFWGENNHTYHNKILSYLEDLGWSSKKKEGLVLSEEKDNYTVINSKELYDYIEKKDITVLSEKRLTKELLSGNFDYINGIISGYFDADGTVLINKQKGNSPQSI